AVTSKPQRFVRSGAGKVSSTVTTIGWFGFGTAPVAPGEAIKAVIPTSKAIAIISRRVRDMGYTSGVSERMLEHWPANLPQVVLPRWVAPRAGDLPRPGGSGDADA